MSFPKELEDIISVNDETGGFYQLTSEQIQAILSAHERAIITELKNLSAEREPYLAHPGDLIAVEVVPLHFIENRLAQLQGETK